MTTWQTQLSEAGYRLTTPRRTVVGVLQEASRPLLPREILARGRRVHPSLGLVTVYRTLELLMEQDLAYRVDRPHDCQGYLFASPGHRHALVCQACGAAIEFYGSNDVDELIDAIEKETGYQVSDHVLQLMGLCPVCQQRQGER